MIRRLARASFRPASARCGCHDRLSACGKQFELAFQLGQIFRAAVVARPVQPMKSGDGCEVPTSFVTDEL